jgi:hypothetical protein
MRLIAVASRIGPRSRADALEDAGCTDQALLGHCRSGLRHVRGCWAIDLLLGRV